MKSIHWPRLLLGALIAAAILFVSDGFLHQRLINDLWQALIATLGVTIREHAGWTMFYFVVFELGRGLVTLFVYALMRPRLGAGPLTAVWAGVVDQVFLDVVLNVTRE